MTNRLGDVVKRMCVATANSATDQRSRNVERFKKEDKSSFVLIQGFLLRAGRLARAIMNILNNETVSVFKRVFITSSDYSEVRNPTTPRGGITAEHPALLVYWERGLDTPHCATILVLCPHLVREPQISFLQVFSIKGSR